MTHHSSQQRALAQAHSRPTRTLFSAKMNSFSSKSSSQRPPRLFKPGQLADNQDLRENGAEQSPCCYDDDYNDEASLESTNTVSVYGNPLWADDQNPCYREGNVDIGTIDNAHDAENYHNYNTSVEDEIGALSMLPLRDRVIYTSDSSDGEDAEPPRKSTENRLFWKARMCDVDSRSTSQNSSNFEFNSVSESSNIFEQQALVQGNLRASPSREMICSDDRVLLEQAEHNISESCLQNLTAKTKSLASLITGTSFERTTDLKKGGAEQYVQASQNSGCPYGGCQGAEHPYQQHYDLAASDCKNIFATMIENNRQSMLWNHGSFKRDMNMLSSQEEDYLYQNSDLLASFEVQDYGKKRDAKEMAFVEEGLPEDACEVGEGKHLLEHNDFSMNEEVVSEFDVNSVENNRKTKDKSKEIRHFNDTRSCSSNDSEHHPENILDGFDALMIKTYAKANEGHPHRRNKHNLRHVKNAIMPAENERPSTVLVCQRVDEKALGNGPQAVDSVENDPQENSAAKMSMLVESGRSINRLQDKDMVQKELAETNPNVAELDLEALQQEILELKRDNCKLGKLLKESQEKLSNFSNERMLWEQKKLSEMSNFNAFKESETRRLKRERAKLEKQTKMLAQLPSKKERNEIEELKAKIANIISEHTKKDSLQNLTINRLRRTITDLTEQIEALQEEVRRYERFLHSELDANDSCRRKVNIPRVLATEQLKSLDIEHDHIEQSSNVLSFQDRNSQSLSSWNRVSTTMHWTRA
ncbi:hypothetical protein GOP47_0028507 [Adiantum capillus-veneris]|nr:hypothetical protein GOP47_0028507 [Adiantum capillus-veneris]